MKGQRGRRPIEKERVVLGIKEGKIWEKNKNGRWEVKGTEGEGKGKKEKGG